MSTQAIYYTHNRHFINFDIKRQDSYSYQILLDTGTELRIQNSGWGQNSYDSRLVLHYLCGNYSIPNGGIRVYHNFNLPDGDLFLVPFDPFQMHVTWKWLEEESTRNDHAGQPLMYHGTYAHVEPPWGAASWPANPPTATFEEAHAHALEAAAAAAAAAPAAAAAAAAQPAAAPRADSLAEPRAYTPR